METQGKREKTALGGVVMHAFSLWQVLGMLKVTDGRGDPLCLGHALHQKKCATRQKRGPCMPRDWISSQEPRWELPDVHSISYRRGGRSSSQFFLLQHPKGFCRSLENLLLLPGPCYFLGRQGSSRTCIFQLCSGQRPY